MWQTYVAPSEQIEKPRKTLPQKTVEALFDAAEKAQDQFDADPELKELYYDQFNQLLDMIEKNSLDKSS